MFLELFEIHYGESLPKVLALRKKHFRTEHHPTASALKGKRELNDDETARLKQLWKKRRW